MALGFAVVETTEDGVSVVHRHGASTFRTTYAMLPDTPRLEITVDADWQESEHLLKPSMPVAVHTLRARYETQYGSIERPAHDNTLADEAQYEVCSHRWVHVAEPGLGVGVVNDSTYGCDVRRIPGGTDLRPTLLRAPRYPDRRPTGGGTRSVSPWWPGTTRPRGRRPTTGRGT